MSISYPTREAALLVPVTEREGELLARFDVDDAVSFEWLTDADVEELGLYGYDDDFTLVNVDDEPQFAGWFVDGSDRPAHVDTSDWDDRDNG